MTFHPSFNCIEYRLPGVDLHQENLINVEQPEGQSDRDGILTPPPELDFFEILFFYCNRSASCAVIPGNQTDEAYL